MCSIYQSATQYDSTKVPITPHSFLFKNLSNSEVFAQLKTLNVRKSFGPDGISAHLIKELAAEIAPPLTFIYNKSLNSGMIPSLWKSSNVTPLHKGGSTDDPTSYRPISVMCVAAKILEKLIATQLHNYLEKQKLLHPHHGAYRHGRSSDHILLYAVNTITKQLHQKKIVCCAFLDLQKAFDSLDHVMLFQRLANVGVSQNSLEYKI